MGQFLCCISVLSLTISPSIFSSEVFANPRTPATSDSRPPPITGCSPLAEVGQGRNLTVNLATQRACFANPSRCICVDSTKHTQKCSKFHLPSQAPYFGNWKFSPIRPLRWSSPPSELQEGMSLTLNRGRQSKTQSDHPLTEVSQGTSLTVNHSRQRANFCESGFKKIKFVNLNQYVLKFVSHRLDCQTRSFFYLQIEEGGFHFYITE